MKMKSKAIAPASGGDQEDGKYVIDRKIKSSEDSIARMKKDRQEFGETEAVKEYRFITQ